MRRAGPWGPGVDVLFDDRAEAGRRLATHLGALRGEDVVVLGLPRGGVTVAAEVARALDAPLDVIVVRKLGVPSRPELAMGAVGEGGVTVLDRDVLAAAGVDRAGLAEVERRERAEVARRVDLLRRGRPRLDLAGRVALVVDDGIATGSTARVACQVARRLGAARVVLAAPVAPAGVVDELTEADAVVCLAAPERFGSVGAFYRDFAPVEEAEVIALLDAAAVRDDPTHRVAVAAGGEVDAEVTIPVDGVLLEGHLRLPARAGGVVLFAHGSGSSRFSPRNRLVADVLDRAGLGTLLLDLLTDDEAQDRRNVFDIELLAQRLIGVTTWLTRRPDTSRCRIGYFGASTGAAAALWAAAAPDSPVAAVVSRGGRPDLAGARLGAVRAPTLLIVGGDDDEVLVLNRRAGTQLRCPHRLDVVPGATHLFEEPGTLASAAALARDWFCAHLLAPRAAVGVRS